MDENIVIGYDGRAESRDALVLGRRLAELARARIILVGVDARSGPLLTGRGQFTSPLAENAQSILAPALAELADLPVETRACEGDPARSLHQVAEAEKAKMIVVGSAQRGDLGHTFMGSVAEGLLSCSTCPVAVAPRGLASGGPRDIRMIGTAFDNSPESHVALRHAAELALAATVTLRVITVLEPFVPSPRGATSAEATASHERGEDPDDRRRHLMETWLEQAIASLPKAVHVEARLVFGSVPDQLALEAETLDLLVLGSRGYGLMRRILRGYVSGSLLRGAACPIEIVPGSAASPGEASCGTACSPQPLSALRE